MLHPEKIFYFAYSSTVDPLVLAGETLRSTSVMRAVLPSYKCIKRSRVGGMTIRKQSNSNIEGLVYSLAKSDFRNLEKVASDFEKLSLYVMMLDSNLLQQVFVFKPRLPKKSAQTQ